MKTVFFSLCLGVLLTVRVGLGQETAAEPAVGQASPPATPAGRVGRAAVRVAGGGGQPGRSSAKPLDENIVLRIKGTIATNVAIDIMLTGCGPSFALNQMMGEVAVNGNKQPIIGQCQADVSLVDGVYNVKYTVGCRVPTVSSTNATNAAVTFVNVTTSSTLALKLGQTVTATSSGDQQLTLSLSAATP